MAVVAILYNDLFVEALSGALTSDVVASPIQTTVNIAPSISIPNALASGPMFIDTSSPTPSLAANDEPQLVSAITFPTIYKERPKGSNANHARTYPVIATDQRTIYT